MDRNGRRPQLDESPKYRSGPEIGVPRVDYFIADREPIRLSYRDSILTFEVAALGFRKTENCRYRYQLEGYSKQWYELGNKREITFTSLYAGKYTLRVMATNGDGIWNARPLVLQIEILPPAWCTWWAFSLYAIIVLISVRGIWLYERRRHRIKSEARRLKELDDYKTRFYTNITHEFRTPLTIILGMVRQIRDNPQRWYREGLQMIHRNGRQLLQLVNQMLDLNKLDQDKLVLQARRGDIVGFIHYLTQSFASLAEGKGIQLHFIKEVDALEMDFDPDQLTKVVSNLLSNAVKISVISASKKPSVI